MKINLLTTLAVAFLATAGSTQSAFAETPYALVSSDPADGTNVESLKNIVTVWAGPAEDSANQLMPAYNTSKSAISLTNAAGETVTDGRIKAAFGTVTVALSQEVTEEGEYTLTIAANSVYLGNYKEVDNNFHAAMIEGTGNAETKLHFTIGAPAPVYEPYTLVSSDPADGATVEKLKNIVTVWSNPAQDPAAQLMPVYNTSKSAISLTNAAGEAVTDGRIKASQGVVTMALSKEITEEGEYTLTIAADAIYLGDYNNMDNMGKGAKIEGTGNEEIKLHFTIGTPAPAYEPYTLVSSDPADGATVEKLKNIVTVWSNPAQDPAAQLMPVYNTSKTAISLTNAAGEAVTDGRIKASQGVVTVALSKEITEEGEYTLTIAADAIYLGDYNNMDNMGKGAKIEGTGNEEIKLHFTIGAPAPVYEPYTLVSSDPADGATVEKLKNITTVWSNPAQDPAAQLMPVYNTSKTAISLTNAAGEAVTDGRIKASQGVVTVALSKEITEEGEYTLTIAADAIYLGDYTNLDNMGKGAKIEGTGNEEIQLHFTIGAPAPVYEPYKLVSSDPADGASVVSLKNIVTEWSNPAQDPAAQLMPVYNTSKSAISLTNAAGEAVTDGRIKASQGVVTITLSKEITEQGEYTLTIAADAIYLGDYNNMDNMGKGAKIEGTGNEELQLHFTVTDPTGIDSVLGEGELPVYFDLNGHNVENPAEGIYIKVVNGKAEKVIL